MRKSRSHAVERLSVPDRHRLRIARDTLKMNDVMARVMGGMTKDEARETIARLTGKCPACSEIDPIAQLHHDQCPLIDGCRCCDDTRARANRI